MAFRIFTDDEIALLKDEKRMQYEKELAIHQQRVAFVERIEALEKVQIETYKPKLEPVEVVTGHVGAFNKPEYVMTLAKPVAPPRLELNIFEAPEQTKPVLPEMVIPNFRTERSIKMGSIRPKLPPTVNLNTKEKILVKSFVKAEKNFPVLPGLKKPKAVARTWRPSKAIVPQLPTVIQPINLKDLNFDRAPIGQNPVPQNIPRMYGERVTVKSFVMPKNIHPQLPGMPVALTEVRSYKKQQKKNIKLPAAVKPEVKIDSFAKTVFLQPQLPKVPALNIDIKTFKNPPRAETELPHVSKPEAIFQPIKQARIKLSVLPPASKPKFSVKAFAGPEYAGPGLPDINTPCVKVKEFNKIKSQDFKKIVCQVSDMPNIAAIHFNPSPFAPLKIHPQVTAPQPKGYNVKPFIMRGKTKPLFPNTFKKRTVEIPDVNLLLKELFPTENKESKKMDGVTL